MVAIGILYLIFENKLLSKSRLPGDSAEAAKNALSRTLIGAQVSCYGTEHSSGRLIRGRLGSSSWLWL